MYTSKPGREQATLSALTLSRLSSSVVISFLFLTPPSAPSASCDLSLAERWFPFRPKDWLELTIFKSFESQTIGMNINLHALKARANHKP
jgi:hypothetical protein